MVMMMMTGAEYFYGIGLRWEISSPDPYLSPHPTQTIKFWIRHFPISVQQYMRHYML